MATTHYTIEQLGEDGRWFIIGHDYASGWAQVYMREQRKQFPKSAFRVVENPSRKLICCEGGPAL